MITAAAEDSGFRPVEPDDLVGWASAFGLTFPVLADTDGDVDGRYDVSRSVSPNYVLLGPGAEIVAIGSKPGDSAIEAVLPTSYP